MSIISYFIFNQCNRTEKYEYMKQNRTGKRRKANNLLTVFKAIILKQGKGRGGKLLSDFKAKIRPCHNDLALAYILQFLFRIKCTSVFCLSFLNETKKKSIIKKFSINVLAIDSRLSIVIA